MKRVRFLKMTIAVLVAALWVGMMGCGSTGDSGGDISAKTKDSYGIFINGKEISLPCTLADLNETGTEILLEYEKNDILASANQEFNAIAATCGDDLHPLYLKLVSGNDPSKKEKNIVVHSIINNDVLYGERFYLKGKLGLGSSVADIMSVYGEDCVLDAVTSEEDLSQGFVMMHYGTLEKGILLRFRDNSLIYISVYIDTYEY